MKELFVRDDKSSLSKYGVFRFLDTSFGYYSPGHQAFWLNINEHILVTQECVFECLSQENKLTFLFNLDSFGHIASHEHSLKTKEEMNDYIDKYRTNKR